MKAALGIAALLLAALAGCATYRPQDIRAGQTEAEVVELMGRPTGRYPGPDGQTRIEYATGPYGVVTWMVDLDAQGKVIGPPQQVLSEPHLVWVQQNARDKNADWLRYQLGRPGEVMQLGWLGGKVWSWRYPTNDCLWFQVTVNDDGTLRDGGGYGIDPRCDPPSPRGGR